MTRAGWQDDDVHVEFLIQHLGLDEVAAFVVERDALRRAVNDEPDPATPTSATDRAVGAVVDAGWDSDPAGFAPWAPFGTIEHDTIPCAAPDGCDGSPAAAGVPTRNWGAALAAWAANGGW